MSQIITHHIRTHACSTSFHSAPANHTVQLLYVDHRLAPARSVNLAAPPQRPHRDQRDNCRIATALRARHPEPAPYERSERAVQVYNCTRTRVRSTSRLYRTWYIPTDIPVIVPRWYMYCTHTNDELIEYAALTIQAHTNDQPNCRRYAVSDRSILLEVETDLTGAHSPRQRLQHNRELALGKCQ